MAEKVELALQAVGEAFSLVGMRLRLLVTVQHISLSLFQAEIEKSNLGMGLT